VIIVEDRKLDELLARAVPEIEKEEDHALEKAPAVRVPEALKARVLLKAETYSAEHLAEILLASAKESGRGRQDLIEAGGKGGKVEDVLDGRGDPRELGAGGFARLLKSAGIDPRAIGGEIAQAVAQFVTIYPKKKRSIFVRAFARSSPEKAANPERPDRDPVKARKAGETFVDEVIAEWDKVDV
jgi:hypothetical protein